MANNTINKIKETLREFTITSLAVDNATSVFLLTFMIMFFGIVSYNTMPKESYPEIKMPNIFINTVYFGNSGEDMENLVTRKIEKELATISEIKTITSSSMQDYSIITAEFNADVDTDDALRKVKDAVDKAKPELPNDLTQEPDVFDVDLSQLPIMTVNLSGEFSNDELRSYAEYLEDEIEDLPEISSVDLKGTMEREVKIDVDIPKMQSRKVSFTDIENAVRSENLTMSGGEMLNNDFRRSIRVIGEFKNIRELENMIVSSENQYPIYLREIASVSFGYKDKTSIARSDKLPVVSLDVIKKSGENLLDASDKIKAIVQKAEEEAFPEKLKVSVFNDQSVQTRDMVSNLENSIISGVLLVVIVLLFFLGLRNAMFVGIAIPLSMLMGFLVLQTLGYTMNMVVLFSLILALGMLVDNAIVVVENIYRYMQNGYKGADAARYGAGEVAWPIIASTATTLAAFIPLAFWPGLMGEFMKYLPITLIVVLSSSLFVALIINPVLTATFMKVEDDGEDGYFQKRKVMNVLLFALLMVAVAVGSHYKGVLWLRNIAAGVAIWTVLNYFVLRILSSLFQQSFLPFLERIYNKFIRAALFKVVPVFVFFGTVALLMVSVVLLNKNMPKIDFFPSADPLYVNAFVEMPMGTDIEATNRLMQQIEDRIEGTLDPHTKIVEAVLAQIGENTSDPNSGEPNVGASPNKARLTVSFVPSQDRNGKSTFEIMEEIRSSVKGFPGVQIVVDKNQDGPPTGKPINIEITGEDIDKLATLSQEMIDYINDLGIGGIEELKKNVNLGKPELLVNINRETARRYEISTYAIANAIRTAVFGKEVSKFKQGDEDYPIQLRVDKKYRNNIDEILNQKITFRSPATGRIAQVPISAVANVRFSSTYNSIQRKDQERSITVYSNILKDYNANEIVEDIKAELKNFDMPRGYAYSFTGEQEEMAENMAFLFNAFMIAMFAIFIILVTQFNSLTSPIIISLSVVFSLIGVLLGYVITGMNLVVIMTGVGIISLAGIVVNNAIVLIDYIALLIKRKREALGLSEAEKLSTADVKEAIIQGGATRLRPVLLTAITTVLGLIPLAIGFNINFATLITDLDPQIFIGGDNVAFWGVMAWTVIYGLTFATFLTLVVVPVMFWLIHLSKDFFTRMYRKVFS